MKCWSLKQRKVYSKAMQGDEFPKGFLESIFKEQVRRRVAGSAISLCVIVWLAAGEAAGRNHTG